MDEKNLYGLSLQKYQTELDRYRLELERGRDEFERYKISFEEWKYINQSAIDYSAQAIKALLILNGASALAFLALIGNLFSSENSEHIKTINNLVIALEYFGWGACLAVLTAFFAYLTQYFYSGCVNEEDATPRQYLFAYFFHIISVLVAVISLFLFIVGMYASINAFRSSDLIYEINITNSLYMFDKFNMNIYEISSIITAMAALGLSLYNIYALKKHNKLLVRPILQKIPNTDYVGDKDKNCVEVLSLKVVNNGLGPAEIIGAKVKYDGKNIDWSSRETIETWIKNLQNEIASNLKGKGPTVEHNICIIKDNLSFFIGTKEERTLFKIILKGNFDKIYIHEYAKIFELLTFKIKYSSIYGEEFEAK